MKITKAGMNYWTRLGLLALGAGALVVGAATAQTGTLFVENDQVGIGTATPTADLEIEDTDFSALRLTTIDGSATWAFSATPLSVFTVNKIGSGGQEFTVRSRNDGDGAATMEVQGSVRATAFNVSSSRALKTDFEPVDEFEVLEKLARIPVMGWRFKEEPQSRRHVGPMAEDFQAAFELGDGESISTGDALGIAMAAIQALRGSLAEKDAQIQMLEARIGRLESQLP